MPGSEVELLIQCQKKTYESNEEPDERKANQKIKSKVIPKIKSHSSHHKKELLNGCILPKMNLHRISRNIQVHAPGQQEAVSLLKKIGHVLTCNDEIWIGMRKVFV